MDLLILVLSILFLGFAAFMTVQIIFWIIDAFVDFDDESASLLSFIVAVGIVAIIYFLNVSMFDSTVILSIIAICEFAFYFVYVLIFAAAGRIMVKSSDLRNQWRPSRGGVDSESYHTQPQQRIPQIESRTTLSPDFKPLGSKALGEPERPKRRAPSQKTPNRKSLKSAEQLRPPLKFYGQKTYVANERIATTYISEVFKGRCLEDDLEVAIKAPRGVSGGMTIENRAADSFLHEAKLWSKMLHPNIVRVYDYSDRPYPWICMEYMDAGDLKIAIERSNKVNSKNCMAWKETIFGIIDALEFAHKKNVIHRDIKPQNILFSSDEPDVPKLTDWGAARTGETRGCTRTLEYATPEQCHGEPQDRRTDIFQVGVLIFKLLTNRLPFEGETEEEYQYQICTVQPPLPTSMNPSLPKEMDEILLKALSKRKEDRYQSISDLKTDLMSIDWR